MVSTPASRVEGPEGCSEGQFQKINSSVAQLQGEVGNLEGVLASVEQDKANKDDQDQNLKDEIAHQSDMIGKLSKEKRSVGDSRQKTEEDICRLLRTSATTCPE